MHPKQKILLLASKCEDADSEVLQIIIDRGPVEARIAVVNHPNVTLQQLRNLADEKDTRAAVFTRLTKNFGKPLDD